MEKTVSDLGKRLSKKGAHRDRILILRIGLEAERTVSEMIRLGPGYIFYSQERRSPGWRRKEPSRKIRLGRSVLELDRILILRRGAHRAGGNKIRLGRSVSEMIRLGPGFFFSGGAHRAGGNKIRLGRSVLDLGIVFYSQERRSRSVSDLDRILILRRGSLGWGWKDPSWR